MRLGLLLLTLLVVGCTGPMPDPVPFLGSDLLSRDFQAEGPIIPRGWSWDADVLWNPASGGRPLDIPPARAAGPPQEGGTLVVRPGELEVATARLVLRVAPTKNYGLRIGAFPGAFRVWANGVNVWESGVLSTDPLVFQPAGYGTLVTVQPREGLLDVVVEMVTADPLVAHSELNRLWVLGPAEAMVASDQAERGWRALQATVLFLSIFVFSWISRLRPEWKILAYFIAFLGVCLLKLLVNVEQPEPMLTFLLPGVSPSVYLFLNHGLNLWPFPLMMLFLSKQFPLDVSRQAVLIVTAGTILASLWEILPFVLLSLGFSEAYKAVMGFSWALVLNLCVVIATLFIFERCYHVFTEKRTLSAALFYGGILIGLFILLPIPLGYFIPVRYTYFLGWGIFSFLFVLGFELIRLQVQSTKDEIRTLGTDLKAAQKLVHYVAPGWATRMGKPGVEDLVCGDHRVGQAILVQIRSSDPEAQWLPLVGAVASSRQALLVEWSAGVGTWALESWPEASLAFALEVQRKLTSVPGLGCRIVLTQALVHFRLLDLSSHWMPLATDLPLGRLNDLQSRAERYGAGLVFDAGLQDGLVIGGWRRHRHFTVAGTEIELYEAEEESIAQMKDKTLDTFQEALAHARSGRREEATQALFEVVQQNPFDLAARALLVEWGKL